MKALGTDLNRDPKTVELERQHSLSIESGEASIKWGEFSITPLSLPRGFLAAIASTSLESQQEKRSAT